MGEERENAGVLICGKRVRYIDPMTDWGFKKLFGSDENREILLGFLQDLFPEQEIADIRYVNPERLGLTEDDRKSVFDVVCESIGGERFIIEMQKRDQMNIRKRGLYYSSYLIQEQGRRGDWDYSLEKVYMVGILDFAMKHNYSDEELEKYADKRIHWYELQDLQTGEPMTDCLAYVFLEAGAFTKKVDELKTEMDEWMYVLKNLPKLDGRPEVLGRAVFRKLFTAAEIAALGHEERKQYERDMMTENDYRNTIEYARYEGMQQGEQTGLAKAATEMKRMGLGTDIIRKATGMSEAEIAALEV